MLRSLSVLLALSVLVAGSSFAEPPDRALRDRVAAIAKESTRGVVAVYYREVGTKNSWGLKDFERLPAASLIKIPLLIELYRQLAAGTIRSDEILTVRKRDKVGGSGVLQGRRTPFRMSIRELSELMITRSDNTATNVLIDRVSMRAVNARIRSMKLRQTELNRKMLQKPPPENWTSARDMGVLLERAVARTLPRPPGGFLDVLGVMSRSKRGAKLGAKLPASIWLARKGGALPRHMHDAAVMRVGDRAVVLVVMIAGFGSNRRAKSVMQRIGAVVGQDLLARARPPSASPPGPAGGSLPAGIRCLLAAYPDHLCGGGPNHIEWCDGTRMPYDDGRRKRDHQARLAAADLEDQMSQRYPVGDRSFGPPARDYDPGRIRYEPFFRKMYGDSRGAVNNTLTTIRWMPGRGKARVRVSTTNDVAKRLQAVSDELERLPRVFHKYVVKPAGVMNWRRIAGTKRLSAHSFAVAIDVGVKYSN